MSGSHLSLVFESYAHFLLSKKGTFKIRNLQTGAQEDFGTSKSDVVNISNEDVRNPRFGCFQANKYYIPTFAVIDSWTNQAMFQMTSLNYPIKSASKQFLALKRERRPTRIIFVVISACQPLRGSTFCHGRWKRSRTPKWVERRDTIRARALAVQMDYYSALALLLFFLVYFCFFLLLLFGRERAPLTCSFCLP